MHYFENAVRYFWRTREKQIQDQAERGVRDQGSRGSVTGGKQMDGFVTEICQLMINAGVDPAHIYTDKKYSYLPGYFRPMKSWDIVVVSDKKLIAVVELKSQVGSFGNNYNNRVEEALGNSEDFWVAYRKEAFKESPQPWLGYLLLVEDVPGSRQPVTVREPHFSVFDEYKNTSYIQRYVESLKRLVLERKYTVACLLTSNKTWVDKSPNYKEPDKFLSVNQFVQSLIRHVRPL